MVGKVMKKYLTAKEAAEYLGMELSTFYTYRSQGLIPCHRFNGRGRPKYVAKELDKLMGLENEAEEILNKNSVGA